ncbi:IS4 family transposase, partial [Paenibacillaceae bacterium T2]|nr:IS4 family transposase [Paenibacillaceae bacterium T2]
MAKGLHVIGMIRDMKQRYDVGGKRMNLQELYRTIPGSKSAEILGSVIVKTGCGLPVKLVFVQNRNKR